MKTSIINLQVFFGVLFMMFLTITGCGIIPGLGGGGIEYGGYVIDISTGQNVTSYKMIVETAGDSDEVSSDDTTGKFSFKIPVGADYTVYVIKDGYRSFKSSNRKENPTTENPDVNQEVSPMVNVPLIPTSMGSPQVNVKIIDEDDGTPISSGAYRVVQKNNITNTTLLSTLYGDGNTNHRFWMPDAPPVAGLISAGAFVIDAGTLIPGFTYDVTTFGVESHRDEITTLNITTTTIDISVNLNIKLNRYNEQDLSDTPALIAQSHVGPDGTNPVPISGRVITLTFDRNIELDKKGLKGLGSHQLISSITSADDDKDGRRTPSTKRTENPGGEVYSQNVSVEVMANTIIIILAPDSALIDSGSNGQIDTDDSLSYVLDSSALFAGIKIRQVGYPYSGGWSVLPTASIKTTVMIRRTP